MDTYARLKRAGITPYWPVHHGTTLSVYYADPDGNRMEFQVDCGTVEQATALMRTPAFADNPAGVMYDPDALRGAVRGWRAGGNAARNARWPSFGDSGGARHELRQAQSPPHVQCSQWVESSPNALCRRGWKADIPR